MTFLKLFITPLRLQKGLTSKKKKKWFFLIFLAVLWQDIKVDFVVRPCYKKTTKVGIRQQEKKHKSPRGTDNIFEYE